MGSITGNRNTLAGNIPPQADLGALEGLKAGFKYPNVMINGGPWEAPKAYKDAKVPPLAHKMLYNVCSEALCLVFPRFGAFCVSPPCPDELFYQPPAMLHVAPWPFLHEHREWGSDCCVICSSATC